MTLSTPTAFAASGKLRHLLLVVYGGRQRDVDAPRRFVLHVRQHVAVNVQRDGDVAVAESFADDLGMDALTQELGCVAVPEIVEADGWEVDLQNRVDGRKVVGGFDSLPPPPTE